MYLTPRLYYPLVHTLATHSYILVQNVFVQKKKKKNNRVVHGHVCIYEVCLKSLVNGLISQRQQGPGG